MTILKEKQQLDEMAILVISSPNELPFQVAIKSPDHLPPHAHIMDKETGKKELGQFLLSKKIPAKPDDVKNYKQGILDEWRPLILHWAKGQCKKFPVAKNWDVLNFEWSLNEK
jgi:hypothetical protein